MEGLLQKLPPLYCSNRKRESFPLPSIIENCELYFLFVGNFAKKIIVGKKRRKPWCHYQKTRLGNKKKWVVKKMSWKIKAKCFKIQKRQLQYFFVHFCMHHFIFFHQGNGNKQLLNVKNSSSYINGERFDIYSLWTLICVKCFLLLLILSLLLLLLLLLLP